jgi:hypothetical protein
VDAKSQLILLGERKVSEMALEYSLQLAPRSGLILWVLQISLGTSPHSILVISNSQNELLAWRLLRSSQ